MPRRTPHPYTVLDVFTDVPLAGNALAVVLEADDLDDATMHAFAREMRLSETTFVQSPTADGADYRNRIWTVGGEVPFAGHPSLGTAVAVARARGESDAAYVQQTGAGLQPVDARVDGERGHASVLQGPAEFGAEVDPAEALAAASLAPSDAAPELPPQVVSTGLPTLIAPLADAGALARAAPDFARLEALLAGARASTLYLAWSDPASGLARARMFCNLVPGGEDPATGSAAGPLCAYLAERAACTRVEISQGVEMGRPSALVAEMEGERPRVGGGVVLVAEGTVLL